jgi:hypothetical protein
VANSYIKPNNSKKKKVNPNTEIKAHWKIIFTHLKSNQKFIWTGDFNNKREKVETFFPNHWMSPPQVTCRHTSTKVLLENDFVMANSILENILSL